MKKLFTHRLSLLLLMLAVSLSVSAFNTDKDYYSAANAYAVPSGAGKVYVNYGSAASTGNTASASKKESKSSAPSHTYYFLASTTDDGYKFDGWYTDADCKNQKTTQATCNQSVTATTNNANNATINLYAKWTPNTYTVTFDAGEGTPDYATKSVTYASTYGDLPGASRRFYTLAGWFNESGAQVTSSTTVSTASNHTLTAHWTLTPEDQTLEWGKDVLFDLAVGSRQPLDLVLAVTASSGLTEFTYEFDKDDVVKIDGEYLVAIGSGEVKVTVHQAGNEFYNAASLEGIFVVSAKETPNFAPNGFSADETCELKVGQSVSLTLTNVSEGLDGDFTAEASTGDVIDILREGNSLTFTAAHEGATTITVAQKENDDIYAASATYSFNVTRYVPEITLSATNLELEQTAVLTLKNVDRPSIQFGTDGVVSYDGNTGVITALKAGSTTLAISQAKTNSIEAKDTTFTITVTKKKPTLTVKINNKVQNSISLSLGSKASVSFDKVSDAEIVVTNEKNATVASYVNGLVTAGAVGKAEYRASLVETETYQGTSVVFTINVTANSSHLPVTGKSYTIGSGEATDWTHKYETLHFDGIPDELTFNFAYIYQVQSNLGNPTLNVDNLGSTYQTILGFLGASNWSNERKGVGNTHMLYVDESEDGKTWTTKWTDDDATNMETRSLNNPIKLSKKTRYVRFHHSSNFSNSYTNIQISELKYVNDPDQTSVDFGEQTLNADPISKTVTVNWCNVAPITVASGDSRIKVSLTSFGNYEDYGTQAITLTYNPSNAAEEIDTYVTLSNGDSQYDKMIHVTAATIKNKQTITWNKDLASTNFAMNVGEQYPDSVITVVASSTNQGRVTFISDDSTIVKVVADTALLATGIGQVNVIAHQAGDAQYQDVSDTVLFNVTAKQKQAIIWEQNFNGLLTTSDPVVLTASASSNGKIKYESHDTGVVRIENDSLLVVVGPGETSITATQEGGLDEESGIDWLKVSQDNLVIVRDPSQSCSDVVYSLNSLTLNSNNKFSDTLMIHGIPAKLTFKAKHGEKTSSTWGAPSYSELIVEEYAYDDNGILDWREIFRQVVTTTSKSYKANRNLSESATIIRFRTLETGTDHTIEEIRVTRPEFIRAKIDGALVGNIIDTTACNTEWKKKISIEHSSIDVMTVYSTQGLLTLSDNSLGDGCNDYSVENLTISFTPTEKNRNFLDTVVITDRKLTENVIRIPVRIYSQGLKQSITFVDDLPATAVATDTTIAVSATADSGLEVSFLTSNPDVAYVADGKLVILSSDTVTITAIQEGDEKFEAAKPVERFISISKAPTTIITAPTAEAITYGQTLNEAPLLNGAADVDGKFVWETPSIVPEAGSKTYNVIFLPTNGGIYAEAKTLVSLTVQTATPTIEVYPVADSITIAQKVGDAQLFGGKANVEGTFDWKNPNENRLKPGTYERPVVFTPNDKNYNTVEFNVQFKVINVLARIIEAPVAIVDNPVYGLTLADVELQGGQATVPGSFAWQDQTYKLQAGTHDYIVLFTPDDLEFYSVVEVRISITVAKATPEVFSLPEASELTYGQTLQDAQLIGGESSVPGAFVWQNAEQTLAVSDELYHEAVIFVPADTANYNTVEPADSVAVKVSKARLTVKANDLDIVVGTTPEFTVSYQGFVNGEDQTVLVGELGFNCEYTLLSSYGNYDIEPYGLTADNYDITFEKGILTVGKAYITFLETPSAKDEIIYNGEPQDLINGGRVDHGELQYRLGEDGEWSTEIPQAVNVGDYTVYYQVLGNDQYRDIDPESIQVSIIFVVNDEKFSQEIYWEDGDEESLGELWVGETMDIFAYAESDLEVTFISWDESIAYIEPEGDGFATIVAVKAGTVIISANQSGDDDWDVAVPVLKTLTVKDVSTAVDEADAQPKAVKLIRDNQLLIIRNGRTYTTSGLLAE